MTGDHEFDFGNMKDIEDEISEELGVLGSWGAAFFLDSKHDIGAAWESNRTLLE